MLLIYALKSDISVLIEFKICYFQCRTGNLRSQKAHKRQVMRLFRLSGSKMQEVWKWPAGDCLPSNEVVKLATYACP